MFAMQVPFVDLIAQHRPLKTELLAAAGRVLDHGQFILGPEVEEFEQKFAKLCGVRNAISVGCGTSALTLTLRALGIGEGDEVITTPNSFLASASSIVLAGATPRFCDIQDDKNMDPQKLEAVITPRTKAVIPVHLTGRVADMDAILAIAERHNLYVIEDAAQAAGARDRDRSAGSFGIAGCFSLHPLKTLNVCGDGGVITTHDDALTEQLRFARNHGLINRDECAFFSMNSRLDTLQAAIALVKLQYLTAWTEKRRRNAAYYQENLADVVQVPQDKPHEYAVYHTFVIQCERRDALQQYLKEKGVGTAVHYRVPIHLQEAAKDLGYRHGDFPVTERQAGRILSLPVHPELTEEQRDFVVHSIRDFYASAS